MSILRRRPTPAMVVAVIALFIALGGPAQAKRAIDGKFLGKGTVTGRAIKNGSIAKADLSKAAVKSLERTPTSSVGSAQIIDGQVLAPDVGAGAVTAPALAMGAVTASKLAADSVGGGSVANGSLQTLDVGSFTGAIQTDFKPFTDPGQQCQATRDAVTSLPPLATPAGGGQPNIADDVIVVTPPAGWPDNVFLTGHPAPGNRIVIVACWIGGDPPPDQGPTLFRYVTFDSP
jgi:hypothetical protein